MSSHKLPIKTGIGASLVWILFLLVAFAIYPNPDNLATGFIVYLVSGVDALGRLSMADVIGLGLLQIGACFVLGYLVGFFIRTTRKDT